MATYNLDAIKNKIQAIANNNTRKKDSGPKLPFWKPTLGESNIRFLPFDDGNGQPFYEVAFYGSKLLIADGYRQVAPAQFGEPDPIFDTLTELSKTHQSKEVWKVMQSLRAKETYYAPVFVRGEEDKGVQVWELNNARLRDVYAILAHPDYMDEDLLDPETGRDFTISCTETDRVFNGFQIKEYSITERKKPSKLTSTATDRQVLIDSIPDFETYFKSRVRDTESYQRMLDNALAGGTEGGNDSSDEGTDHSKSRGVDSAAKDNKATKAIEDAFEDL